MNQAKPSVAFRTVALSLAVAFLAFSIFQAGGLGCSRPGEPPIAKEETAAAPSAPAPSPASTGSSEFGTPLVDAAQKPAAASKPATSKPPRYFPGTKAAPMPWAQEPQPQQKNPAPNQAVTPK
jgi:hypothetical protein